MQVEGWHIALLKHPIADISHPVTSEEDRCASLACVSTVW